MLPVLHVNSYQWLVLSTSTDVFEPRPFHRQRVEFSPFWLHLGNGNTPHGDGMDGTINHRHHRRYILTMMAMVTLLLMTMAMVFCMGQLLILNSLCFLAMAIPCTSSIAPIIFIVVDNQQTELSFHLIYFCLLIV